MIARLARFAARIETGLDRLIVKRRRARVIEVYAGYPTPAGLVVRGRVLAAPTGRPLRPGQGAWRNFRNMVRLFMTREVPGVQVAAAQVATVTDAEGYFAITVPRETPPPVRVTCGALAADCPVMLPGPGARIGVISDIDDTLMRTDAAVLWRNLWRTLAGNPQTRQVHPDAVPLMRALAGAAEGAVFYVSSSPWNLHAFLCEVFRHNGLPAGAFFLRDFGLSETQVIAGPHGLHKAEAIDRVLAALPDLRFWLIGDTGQDDPAIYADAVLRHPGRIAQVALRLAGRGLTPAVRDQVDRMTSAGVPVWTGDDYSGLAEALKVNSASPATV